MVRPNLHDFSSSRRTRRRGCKAGRHRIAPRLAAHAKRFEQAAMRARFLLALRRLSSLQGSAGVLLWLAHSWARTAKRCRSSHAPPSGAAQRNTRKVADAAQRAGNVFGERAGHLRFDGRGGASSASFAASCRRASAAAKPWGRHGAVMAKLDIDLAALFFVRVW